MFGFVPSKMTSKIWKYPWNYFDGYSFGKFLPANKEALCEKLWGVTTASSLPIFGAITKDISPYVNVSNLFKYAPIVQMETIPKF